MGYGDWECAGNLYAHHVYCIPGWFGIFQGIQIDRHGEQMTQRVAISLLAML
jgi:hypothetical protein